MMKQNKLKKGEKCWKLLVIQKLGVVEMANEAGETFRAFNTSQAWFYNKMTKERKETSKAFGA